MSLANGDHHDRTTGEKIAPSTAPLRGMKLPGRRLCPGPAVGSGDPGQGLCWENADG